MFVRLFLALLVLLALMWFMAWYGKAAPDQRNNAIKKGLLFFIAIALLVLAVTGRIPIIFAAISAIIPFIHRLLSYRGIIRMLGRLVGQRIGATTLTTVWLIVEYDLHRRSLDGTVIKGQFVDKKLSQLDEKQLNSLLEEVKLDFQSRTAVNAFIMARRGQAYTQQQAKTGSGSESQITLAQAHEILGLETNTTPEEIKRRHKRLIQKLHPDRGGSSYLAAQINTAKDVLLDHYV